MPPSCVAAMECPLINHSSGCKGHPPVLGSSRREHRRLQRADRINGRIPPFGAEQKNKLKQPRLQVVSKDVAMTTFYGATVQLNIYWIMFYIFGT